MMTTNELKSKAAVKAKALGHTLGKWEAGAGCQIAQCRKCRENAHVSPGDFTFGEIGGVATMKRCTEV